MKRILAFFILIFLLPFWAEALPVYKEVRKNCVKSDSLLLDRWGKPLHELPEFDELAIKYGLTYGAPDWMDGIVARYGLNPPSH